MHQKGAMHKSIGTASEGAIGGAVEPQNSETYFDLICDLARRLKRLKEYLVLTDPMVAAVTPFATNSPGPPSL
jgi:hypothetical protein